MSKPRQGHLLRDPAVRTIRRVSKRRPWGGLNGGSCSGEAASPPVYRVGPSNARIQHVAKPDICTVSTCPRGAWSSVGQRWYQRRWPHTIPWLLVAGARTGQALPPGTWLRSHGVVWGVGRCSMSHYRQRSAKRRLAFPTLPPQVLDIFFILLAGRTLLVVQQVFISDIVDRNTIQFNVLFPGIGRFESDIGVDAR